MKSATIALESYRSSKVMLLQWIGQMINETVRNAISARIPKFAALVVSLSLTLEAMNRMARRRQSAMTAKKSPQQLVSVEGINGSVHPYCSTTHLQSAIWKGIR
jgi:F0F1-type ATP synthase membrane subunit a